MCLNIYSVCIYVYYGCAWSPRRSEEGKRFLGIGVMDNCEPPFVLGTKPGSFAGTIGVLNS